VSYARFRVTLQPTNSEKVVLSAIKCDTRCRRRRRGRRVTVLLPKPPAVDDVSVALYRTYITVSVHFCDSVVGHVSGKNLLPNLGAGTMAGGVRAETWQLGAR